MQNKSHNHVNESRTFVKGSTRSELTITLIRRTLTKSIYKLVFRHSFKTLTTRVVEICYPKDTKHVGYNIRCDHNARIVNASNNPMETDSTLTPMAKKRSREEEVEYLPEIPTKKSQVSKGESQKNSMAEAAQQSRQAQ